LLAWRIEEVEHASVEGGSVAWRFNREVNLLRPDTDSLVFTLEGGDEYENPNLMRTQIRQPTERGLLLKEIVADIADMHLMEQWVLALYIFEEATADQINNVLGLTPTNTDTGVRIRAARQRVLAYALTRVSRKPYTIGTPPRRWTKGIDQAQAWCSDTYRLDLSAYLADVRALYTADPYYVATILQQANGSVARHGNHSRPNTWHRALTDDQVREIRARRAAGESLNSIATDYGVSRAAIGSLIRGDTYADVA
jgi:hypothetical protein